MGKLVRLAVLLILVPLCATLARAQQEAPAPQAEAKPTEAVPPDQEVEVNEDNYRQFMELKDDLRQRTVVPEDSFASRSGLQKLDNLPEASQKHLRDELREIISRGERWQPGDENADYPYVPSEAAMGNARLQNQEAEAWGELLDNYHEREAQIYANAARSRAAAAAAGALPGQAGASRAGEANRAGQAAQADQQQDSQTSSSEDSFTPGAQNADGEQNAEGVAQNAMEFLEQAGYQGGNAETGAEQNAMEFLQQAQNQQAAGQMDGTSETGSEHAGNGSESSADEDQQDTAAVVAQESVPEAASSDSDEPATEGASQNALEYLAGEDMTGGDAAPDTLSIEDLLNARGVDTGAGAAQEIPDEPPQDPPD